MPAMRVHPVGEVLRIGLGLGAVGPLTWTSIGAGAPKFRIWLMMSAGRKEKVEPGKRSGSALRSCWT